MAQRRVRVRRSSVMVDEGLLQEIQKLQQLTHNLRAENDWLRKEMHARSDTIAELQGVLAERLLASEKKPAARGEVSPLLSYGGDTYTVESATEAYNGLRIVIAHCNKVGRDGYTYKHTCKFILGERLHDITMVEKLSKHRVY